MEAAAGWEAVSEATASRQARRLRLGISEDPADAEEAGGGRGGSTSPAEAGAARGRRSASVDVNPPGSPRPEGFDEDALSSAQKPRIRKRGRGSESDSDSGSDSDGSGGEASDWHSAAARRVAKRLRSTADGPGGGAGIGRSEAERCQQDPARRLMVEARAATLTHNLAMTMERKMAVRAAGAGAHDAAAMAAERARESEESGSERGSTAEGGGLPWSGAAGRWGPHGGRSPSPAMSTMSGCSVAANAPLSPTSEAPSYASDMSHMRALIDGQHGRLHTMYFLGCVFNVFKPMALCLRRLGGPRGGGQPLGGLRGGMAWWRWARVAGGRRAAARGVPPATALTLGAVQS